MSRKRLVAVLTIICTIWTCTAVAPGAVVQAVPAVLWDLFPRTTQGENGIFLQRRDVGTSNYVDLVNTKDYQWTTPDVNFGIPAIFRDPSPVIFAHPAAVNGTGFDRDSAMSVVLEGNAFPAVRVTGQTTTGAAPTVGFYIYKGADNWNAPLFQSGPFAPFDLTIPYTPGDKLYFATTAIGTDVDAWAKWDNIQLVGVPEPSAAIPLVVAALGAIRRRRITFRSATGGKA